MPLEALIFDVDGTLAETEEAHRQAFNDTFAIYGLNWHWTQDDYRQLLKTTGGKERMAAHAKSIDAELDPALVAQMHVDKTERYGSIIAGGGVALRRGIAELIASARQLGLQIGVATTTNRPNVDALCLATFGRPAEAVFDVIAAGDEVARKKPHADVFQLSLERLGLPAANCLALEDSRNGLQAAMAAGIATVVAPGFYTLGEDFTGALAVVDEFDQIGDLARLAALI